MKKRRYHEEYDEFDESWDELVESDEITAEEAAFMRGWMGADE